MKLSGEVLEQLREHARAMVPFECCGLVGGRDGVGQTLYRARNVASSPTHRYEIDGEDQLRALAEMEAAGEQLVAVYHSHTGSAAFPSQDDVELATYPDVLHLITSVVEGGTLRAFRIRDGVAERVDISLI